MGTPREYERYQEELGTLKMHFEELGKRLNNIEGVKRPTDRFLPMKQFGEELEKVQESFNRLRSIQF